MKAENKEKRPVLGYGIFHPGSRPMQIFVDENGCWWL